MSLSTYLAVLGVMIVASTVQSSAGFGQGLVAAPLLRLLHAPLLPGPIVVAGLVVSTGVWLRNSKRHDLPVVVPAIGGRVLGIGIAVLLLAALSDRGLSIAIGAFVLGLVLLRLADVSVARTVRTLFGTGIVSGVGGTIAALGGTPMALLLEQHSDARDFRGPMGWFTMITGILTVVALVLSGELDGEAFLLGLSLLPPIAVGWFLARWVTPIIDRGYLRPLVLGLSGTSALVLVVGQLF